MTAARNPQTADAALVAGLGDRVIRTLRRHVPTDRPVALLDFPDHSNCGDSAIWLGERAALRTLGADVADADLLPARDPARLRRRLGRRGVVLLHGGGNFGTLYPGRQRLREQAVAAFPDNPIVQLPQTIHFADPAALARARAALAAHRNLTVLARDAASLATATGGLGVAAELCPDMAFALGPVARRGGPRTDILWLRRGDAEQRAADAPPADDGAGVVVRDWLHGSPAGDQAAWLRAMAARGLWSCAVRLHRVPPLRGVARAAQRRSFDRLAGQRLRRGCDHLSLGRVVVTDRLHGHILCLLLGVPHVILDTRQRKLRDFHETFTAAAALTHVAQDPAGALRQARALLDAAGGQGVSRRSPAARRAPGGRRGGPAGGG